MFDPLIAEYNARVLMHRDLTFVGEGYLESLAEAWDTLIKIKKVELGVEEIDEDALVKEFLRGNEPSDLSTAKALYSRDSPLSKEKDAIAGPSETESSVPPSTLSSSRPPLDPFEQHIGYDPEDLELNIHVVSVLRGLCLGGSSDEEELSDEE